LCFCDRQNFSAANQKSTRQETSLPQKEQKMDKARAVLIACDQGDLITKLDTMYQTKWSAKFCEQVMKLNANYPGGLLGYVNNARKLLAASNSGENPLADVTSVEVPKGVTLDYDSDEFGQYEQTGVGEIPYMCFVLVAGGLGERLGFSGIKLALPVDLASNETYLGMYCHTLIALGSRCGVEVPLVIMTSDDTHERTEELLRKNSNFGMSPSQIRLIKQEKVAALVNANGGMLLDDDGMLLTKPHGHGDVHLLLHQTGIARQWAAEGKKWVCFFQDTNGLVFKTMLAVVGVSELMKFDLNSMCIPRLAKQEIGAITTLNFKNGTSITANTEYNQLGPLLVALGKEGDVPDSTGYSPFPGNINQVNF
jgi:UDP-sugar pyrophosphorylase